MSLISVWSRYILRGLDGGRGITDGGGGITYFCFFCYGTSSFLKKNKKQTKEKKGKKQKKQKKTKKPKKVLCPFLSVWYLIFSKQTKIRTGINGQKLLRK